MDFNPEAFAAVAPVGECKDDVDTETEALRGAKWCVCVCVCVKSGGGECFGPSLQLLFLFGCR